MARKPHIHILGVGGTLMAAIASLALEKGYHVTGQDKTLYPPMSDVIATLGIPVRDLDTLDASQTDRQTCLVGNAFSRGQPIVEELLTSEIPYTSGPAWLAEEVLKDRTVLAVSGTHGKTTTASCLAWILTCAQCKPGFLIGGMPKNFNKSAVLGTGKYFVIEADEYDSAFFDKRPKFMHYRPHRLIINTIEYDHADIYPNIEAICQQFGYLLRTVPPHGGIIRVQPDAQIDHILAKGCWSPVSSVQIDEHADLWATDIQENGRIWRLMQRDQYLGTVHWSLIGTHNIQNALLSVQTALSLDIPAQTCIEALASFKGVARRFETLVHRQDLIIYDDFAHHPTAIKKTLKALRAEHPTHRLIAIIHLGTRSMEAGVNQALWPEALADADATAILSKGPLMWDKHVMRQLKSAGVIECFSNADDVYDWLKSYAKPNDRMILMGNSHFGNLRARLQAVDGKQGLLAPADS